MRDSVTKHLFDIRHACELILKYAGGMSYQEYVSSEPTSLIVERLLITIGEAIMRLRDMTMAAAPVLKANVRGILAVRNNMVHNYDDIDQAAVYAIITKYVPALLREVNELMATEETGATG